MFSQKEISENKELVLEQLIVANTITLEAIIKLLELKGIINSKELVDQIKLISSTKNQKFN